MTFNLNPIIIKEFRSRMRGWRAFAILTAYLLFLAFFSYGVYQMVLFFPIYGTPLSPVVGQSLYSAIMNLSLVFVAFLMPALTATAISSEQERLTLEMLQATPLSPHTILIGKLVSSAGYIFLLIFAAVPLISLVFIFGGVTLADIALGGLIILATALTYGIIGLFFSAWRKRTIQALVFSYLTIIVMIAGSYALYIFWGVVTREGPPRHLLLLNPFSALASVVATNSLNYSNPVLMLSSFSAGWGPWMISSEVYPDLYPLWYYTLAFYLGLGLGLYFLATRLIKPIRPWRLSRLGLITMIGLLLLYLVGSAAVFMPDVQAEIEARSLTPTPAPFGPMLMERAVPIPTEALNVEPTTEPAGTGESEAGED